MNEYTPPRRTSSASTFKRGAAGWMFVSCCRGPVTSVTAQQKKKVTVLAHSRCSRECLEAAVHIHETAVKGSDEWTYNDQNAVVKLWMDGSGTCDLAKLPASMQSVS